MRAQKHQQTNLQQRLASAAAAGAACIFAFCNTTSVEAQASVGPFLDVGGAVFPETCHAAMIESDLDGDGYINQDEYIIFAQLLSPPGLLDSVTEYEELPAAFQAAFVDLACTCSSAFYGGDPTDTDCCVGPDAAIRIPAPPVEDQSVEDFRLQYAICGFTDQAARLVIDSAAPTAKPTTLSPSTTPTQAPSTRFPSATPSATPTKLPSTTPSVEPTAVPTSTPSLQPSTSLPTGTPSAKPSWAPVITPYPTRPTTQPTLLPTTKQPTSSPTTEEPTANPSAVPTQAPTTKAPSKAPTERPSTTPTLAPTDKPTVTPGTIFQQRAIVRYNIVIEDGLDSTDVSARINLLSDLIAAMDRLAPEVAVEVFSDDNRSRRQLNQPSDNGRIGRMLRYVESANKRGVGVSGKEQSSALVEKSRRRLEVTIELPTGIDGTKVIDCADAGISADSNDLCEEVTARIAMIFVDENEEDIPEQVGAYQASLEEAIANGRLQDFLDDVNENSPISIADLSDKEVSGDDGDDDDLSAGATAGIVLAALFVGLVPLIIFLIQRSGREDSDKPDAAEYEAYGNEEGDNPSLHQESVGNSSMYTDAAVSQQPPAPTLGAAQLFTNDYSPPRNRELLMEEQVGREDVPVTTTKPEPVGEFQSKVAVMKTMEELEAEDIVAEPEMDVAPDSSSNAGSSGWSSSAGISSLNTGSMDDSMDAAAAAGTTLAAIGASSALSRKLEKVKTSDAGGSAVSRAQLDSLIEAGDWAAVGATAALLAAASDSQSASSRSRTSRSRSSRSSRETDSSIDVARAAELDHLVDAGDWEGVVLAAAKFEAAESVDGRSDKGSRTGSSLESGASAASGSGTDSATGTGTGTGTGSPSASTSMSESPSKAQKRAEIRAEVEALVRRVVPEEIDNVDEMMNQFKGREEELVETLRTMQERAVAQKARAAGHRAAKVQARRSVQRGVVPGTSTVAQRVASIEGTPPKTPEKGAAESVDRSKGETSASGSSGQEGSSEEPKTKSSLTEGESSGESAMNNRRTALEMAIEAGDWEAVGEAAAMMSDASVTTASTGEVERLAAAASVSSSSTSRKALRGVTAERAAELDDMINKGDWDAVVAAASRFNKADKRVDDNKVIGDDRRSKEEEDALAQAELWMKIAEQKKPVATAAGASDAAEWAIQRSLSQLKEAEKKQGASRRDGDRPDHGDEDEV